MIVTKNGVLHKVEVEVDLLFTYHARTLCSNTKRGEIDVKIDRIK